jgi:hypothetical protein
VSGSTRSASARLTWLNRDATVLRVVVETQRGAVLGALVLLLTSAVGCQDSFSADGGDGSSAISKDELLLWLRADRGVSVQAGRVAAWADQSGNAMDAMATDPVVRPTLVVDGLGGKSVVQFDGVDDFLTMPQGFEDFSAGVSVFALATASPSDQCRGIFESSNGAEVDDVHVGRHGGLLHYEVLDTVITGQEFPVDAPELVAAIHRSSEAVELRRNGSLSGEGAMLLPTAIPRTENFVGRTLYADCPTFSGQIAEILVYGRAVEERELVSIESYLANKWGCCSE